jgi:hypothetical protein
VRFASAGRFDAGGEYLVCVADLSGVPQVWGVGRRGWPELLLAPPDRAQTVYLGPRSGQLAVGADVDGNEHTQLLYVPESGATWRALTDDPERIHTFGSFSSDGRQISFAANTRSTRWFDISVLTGRSMARRRAFLLELSPGAVARGSARRAAAATAQHTWRGKLRETRVDARCSGAVLRERLSTRARGTGADRDR